MKSNYSVDRFLLLFVSLFFLVGCKDEAKLRMAVYQANRQCPITVSGIGNMTHVDFDGEMVTCEFDCVMEEEDFQKIETKASDEVMVGYLIRKSPEFIQMLVNDEAGLRYRFHSKNSDKTAVVEIPADRLAQMVEEYQSKGDDPLQLLKLFNRQSVKQLPIEVEEGLLFTNILIKDNMEVFTYEIDPQLYDMDLIGKNMEDLKDKPEELLDMEEEETQVLVSLLTELNMGVRYSYVEKGGSTPINLTFSAEQIKRLNKDNGVKTGK